MTWMKLPLFAWATYITSIIQLIATPVLGAAITMILLDRNFGTGFLNATKGGDPLLYQHIFWFYSHPAVYIMILPGFGAVSPILTAFSAKRVFGYTAMVLVASIAVLGFWYGRTTCSRSACQLGPRPSLCTPPWPSPCPPVLRSLVGWRPCGVVDPLYHGHALRLGFHRPLCARWLRWFDLGLGSHRHSVARQLLCGWSLPLHLGGWLADADLGHDLLLVANDRRYLNEAAGKVGFVLMFFGIFIAFGTMHISGALGMARRIPIYREEFLELNHITTGGYILTAIAALIVFISICASYFKRPTAPGDAWEVNDMQRSFEWATTSPPPVYNYENVPPIPVTDPHLHPVDEDKLAAASTDSDEKGGPAPH